MRYNRWWISFALQTFFIFVAFWLETTDHDDWGTITWLEWLDCFAFESETFCLDLEVEEEESDLAKFFKLYLEAREFKQEFIQSLQIALQVKWTGSIKL